MLVLVSVGLITGCASPYLAWPEVAFDPGAPVTLRIGAAALPITPEEPTFLAGGIPYRRALAVHDDIWARAVVVDDGVHRVALVALDLIGLFYDDVVRIREDVAGRVGVDYVLIAATHTHNAPDLLGAWSPTPFCYDDSYRIFVGQQVAGAVAQAVEHLRPARIRVAAGTSGDPPLSKDSRLPVVIDDTLTVWQAVDADTGAVICTSIHYAVHPILIPSFNFDISSDFVHYLRTAIESGMEAQPGPVAGQGGMCVFFNGALGGRITPRGAEPLVGGPQVEPAYERAQGYGYLLARRVQELLANQAQWLDEPLALAVDTRQIHVPLQNPLLQTGVECCFLERALVDGQVTSEVGMIHLGPLEFFAVPGMIFPELVLGGVTPLPGSDFPDALPESPTLAELATEGSYFIVVGLANDMLGYLIPKAQWDADPPFTTDNNTAPYGEIISAGPDAAWFVINAFAALRLDPP